MNDIFKIFKKRAQAGKSTNIKDVIKDLNENEKNEIGKFDRGNKSYLSISKSGRLKSKKASAQSANAHRMINEELFKGPIMTTTNDISQSVTSNSSCSSGESRAVQMSNNSLASSANSSFRSSLEDVEDMASISSSSSSSTSPSSNAIMMIMVANATKKLDEIIDYGSMKTNCMWQNKF